MERLIAGAAAAPLMLLVWLLLAGVALACALSPRLDRALQVHEDDEWNAW